MVKRSPEDPILLTLPPRKSRASIRPLLRIPAPHEVCLHYCKGLIAAVLYLSISTPTSHIPTHTYSPHPRAYLPFVKCWSPINRLPAASVTSLLYSAQFMSDLIQNSILCTPLPWSWKKKTYRTLLDSIAIGISIIIRATIPIHHVSAIQEG